MLHLYVLYACAHLIAGKHHPQAGKTQCAEKEVFFQADPCKREIPKPGRLLEHSKRERSWLECKETRAESWIPADANAGGNRLYQAQASASDKNALAALLAPLPPQERAKLESGEIKGSFEGPGNLSFFIVGSGSIVQVYAVTNLDDFQFAQMDADVSSATAATSSEPVDFQTIAEDAGVDLSYHTESSKLKMPPPGGIEVEP